MKKISYLMLMFALLFMGAVSLNAQVTIGSQENPHPGSVLDLSQVAGKNLGFLLPNVALDSDLTKFVLNGEANKATATGMLVYNTTDSKVYFWTIDAENPNGFWAKLSGGASPSVPPVAATGMTLGVPAKDKIYEGETMNAPVVTLEPTNAVQTVTWTSSNPTVASVDPVTGLVTGLTPGTTNIIATTPSGKTASYPLTVEAVVPAATGVTLGTPAKTTIAPAEQIDAPTATVQPSGADQTVTWTSSNPGVATVDPDTGKVTGVASGTTTITATTPNGKTASYTVTVEVPIVDGPGTAIKGRILRAAKAGDDSDWIEIATNGGYSLILRDYLLPTTTPANSVSCARSEVTTELNKWYNDGLSRQLQPGARLRNYAVGNNAASQAGTGSINDGFSVPTTTNMKTGNGVLFVLSYGEAVRFCSNRWTLRNGTPTSGQSTVIAIANYAKITDYSQWMWSRTDPVMFGPGGHVSYDASFSSTFTYIRPAMWVKSTIFTD